MKKNNYYITTPIYYPSGEPHMGHAYSSIVADVFARFNRIQNCDVFFLTGTDEHGLKIQRAAERAGQDTKSFCDKISDAFIKFNKSLNLSNDDFIRTTEVRHHNAVKDLWNKLVSSGDIYLSKYKGWYSVSDEAYYSNDEIIVKDGKKTSISSGSLVEWVEEESFFFKLSKWQNPLLELYEKNDKFIVPNSRKNEVVNFVKSGLKDLSVSRTSFSWGIKVPDNKNHVIYVWLDALTNYLSAVKYPDIEDDLYKKYWPASLHVIGKDILRFHAVYWPAFLLAAGIKPPKRILSHGWILSDEEKMSKSKGNILNPIELIKKYGIDQIRYYLMKEVSLGNDGSISLKNLEKCINSDLANNFGNLCQRVFSFVKNNCSNKIPVNGSMKKEDLDLREGITSNLETLRELMNDQKLNEYLKKVVEITFDTNKYINDMEPWKLRNKDINRMNTILNVALGQICKISILLNPIIPISTNKVLDAMNVPKKSRNFLRLKDNDLFKPDSRLENIDILFKKFI